MTELLRALQNLPEPPPHLSLAPTTGMAPAPEVAAFQTEWEGDLTLDPMGMNPDPLLQKGSGAFYKKEVDQD